MKLAYSDEEALVEDKVIRIDFNSYLMFFLWIILFPHLSWSFLQNLFSRHTRFDDWINQKKYTLIQFRV